MRLALLNAESLPIETRDTLDMLVARVNQVFEKEHNGDGTHKTAWTDIAFDATHYTASGSLVWTVTSANRTTFAYMLQGKTLLVSGIWDTTSTSGVASSLLKVRIPGGYVAKRLMQGAAFAIDNGTGCAAYNRVQANGTVIEIGKADLTNWSAASASNTYVRIHFAFEVQ